MAYYVALSKALNRILNPDYSIYKDDKWAYDDIDRLKRLMKRLDWPEDKYYIITVEEYRSRFGNDIKFIGTDTYLDV